MNIADARSIAVVRTRLPYIDRRSLSQAWFSALHVASDGKPSPAATPRARTPATSEMRVTRRSIADVKSPPVASPTVQRVLRSSTGRGRAEDTVSATRSTPSRARRAALRAVAPPATGAAAESRSYPPFQTSLTVGVEGARVALLLRRVGSTLHVVALCAPANVELVRRALACADAHLRLYGDRMRASVRSTDEVRA